MSNPFLGELRMFAGNFAPLGWALCQGQLLPIDQHDALFSLLGTTHGGNGESTFGLPDMRGRVPVHQGTGAGLSTRQLGESGGVERVTLTSNQMPSHSHAVRASSAAATGASVVGGVLAATAVAAYGSGADSANAAAQAVTSHGSSTPHTNMAPFLSLNYIIALEGVYPSQN